MEKHAILIVDDEPNQVMTLAGYLKKSRRFQIFTATNGEQGLTLIKTQPIEVILTDMRMPIMDGLELLKSVRKLNPDISVIVMTAYGRVEDAVAG